MSTASAGASYISSAAAINLIQGAASEHGITVGQNTATLAALALGVVIHYIVELFAANPQLTLFGSKVNVPLLSPDVQIPTSAGPTAG